jgi:thiamine-monophosphate kinase
VREKSLIDRIRRVSSRGPGVAIGIGDDCAVLRIPSGHELLVTTDFTLENVHFRRNWHAPEVVGWRCLTRGLSDIAAMGGEPRAAFLSLALDRKVPQMWVNRFMSGLLEAAKEFRVPLAGGDTAQSDGGIQADIVLVGSVPRGKAIPRSGARPGDLIYVTGELGGAAAALARLRQGKVNPLDYPRHFHPQARISVGLSLRRRNLASAMIDLSDGLSTDLQHICDESGIGAEIDEVTIPRAKIGRRGEPVSLELALHGGEDYELLFTSARKLPKSIAGVPVTPIGRITRKRGLRLLRNGRTHPLTAQGWEHFSPHP